MIERDSPEYRLKHAAERLFSNHGIHGVGLREIVREAGYQNSGTVRQHFGTKNALILAIAVEGLRASDAWRREKLSKLEASGAQMTTRDCLYLIVGPPLEGVTSLTFMRFLAQFELAERPLYRSVVNKETGEVIRRITAKLAELLSPLPTEYLLDRLDLCYRIALMFMSHRAATTVKVGNLARWRSRAFTEQFMDTLDAALHAPPSAGSLSAYAEGSLPDRLGHDVFDKIFD